VALNVRLGAAQEPDGRRSLLVGEDFGVGQARAVIDGDVNELPAGGELLAVIAKPGACLPRQ
jgi:hypothetical protein